MTEVEAPVQNLDSLKEQILESDRCIRESWTKESKQSMLRGWSSAFIERKGGWELLGFKHQHAYRIAVGISYSNWYRTMAVAEKFAKLERDTYLSMKLENAELLGRQEDAVRYSKENIEAAGTLSIAEFKERISPDVEIKPDVEEHWSTLELKMRKGQRAAIEDGIKIFQEKHGFDSPAYALEMMVADAKQGPMIAGFIQQAIPEITQTVRETADLEDLRLAILDFIQELGDISLQYCDDETD